MSSIMSTIEVYISGLISGQMTCVRREVSVGTGQTQSRRPASNEPPVFEGEVITPTHLDERVEPLDRLGRRGRELHPALLVHLEADSFKLLLDLPHNDAMREKDAQRDCAKNLRAEEESGSSCPPSREEPDHA